MCVLIALATQEARLGRPRFFPTIPLSTFPYTNSTDVFACVYQSPGIILGATKVFFLFLSLSFARNASDDRLEEKRGDYTSGCGCFSFSFSCRNLLSALISAVFLLSGGEPPDTNNGFTSRCLYFRMDTSRERGQGNLWETKSVATFQVWMGT